MYWGEEKLSRYCPGVEGAINGNVTVWVVPGVIVTPVCDATTPEPSRFRLIVMICVILDALLVRWIVALAVCPLATWPNLSMVDVITVESTKPGFRLLFTRILPLESRARAKTTSFFAPTMAFDVIFTARLVPVKVGENARNLLGFNGRPTT